jgi:hypothetical protein
LAAAPGTHILLLIVTVTSLMQRGLDETTATRVLRHASTNLFQMSQDAPRVLFLSAFLVDHAQLVTEAIVFTVVMVPVERWVGTYRWLATFVAGHVGATLATTLGIWLQVRGGGASRDLVYPVDVGVSYGVYAVAGVLPRRLPRPLSYVVSALFVAVVVKGVVEGGTFTDWGHAAALLIGFAMGPLVDPRATRAGDSPASAAVGGGAWHWLATPPTRVGRFSSLSRVIVGIGAIVAAGVIVAVLVWSGSGDVDLPAGTLRVHAVVVDPLPTCAGACTNAVVSYRIGGTPYVATVRIPAHVALQRRERLDLDVDPADRTRPQVPRPARHASIDGLFGATAAALGCIGVIVLLRSRRPAGLARE